MEETNQELACSICLESITIDTVYETPCHHHFHQECWNQWSRSNRSISCPNCRYSISRPHEIRIHLPPNTQGQNDPRHGPRQLQHRCGFLIDCIQQKPVCFSLICLIVVLCLVFVRVGEQMMNASKK